MSAPMTNHSGGRLAATVSQAGGLGSFAGIHSDGPDFVQEQIRYIRSQTDMPFGIGFITHLIPDLAQNFEAALDEKVPVIAFSFGDPEPWLTRAREAGRPSSTQGPLARGARHKKEGAAPSGGSSLCSAGPGG